MKIANKIHRCNCSDGYIGEKCNLQVSGAEGQGKWYLVQGEDELSLPPRTAHTTTFVANCIWVFGGFDLNRVLSDLWQYCIHENMWRNISQKITIDEEHFFEYDNETQINQTLKFKQDPWPAARSGHAMDVFEDGFFVFGGTLGDGSHSRELWFFNTTTLGWDLKARSSIVSPENVTDHTITLADDFLYLLGGKNDNRVFVDSVYRISARFPQEWEKVLIKGGVYPPKKLVGHTTVYHKPSRSLLVFGGYTQPTALFGDRTKDILMLNIENLYWSKLENDNWNRGSRPRDRAFHSAVQMGNYMVVYGGNTHNHHEIFEICYNHQVFFYHLSCHVWLNHTYFTGQSHSSTPLINSF